MPVREFSFINTEGSSVHVYCWSPEGTAAVKAVVQIIHGMSEHAGRYDWFAHALNDRGCIVYAHDQRGHGKTAGKGKKLGHLEPEKDWDGLVNDTHRLGRILREENPGLPVYLFAHSMGSFVGRHYISRYGAETDGILLSGTGLRPSLLLGFGRMLTKMGILFSGSEKQNRLVDFLSFGAYNNRYSDRRTKFDWLSRDPEEVDTYIGDPLCGVLCTTGFFYSLFSGIREIQKPENVECIPKELPVFIAGGGMDPVGSFGKDLIRLAEMYRSCGMQHIQCKIYPGARHELIHEINREEFVNDIQAWLDDQL
jgi:alpha-beta hydrolase superfamily lysophospholipase